MWILLLRYVGVHKKANSGTTAVAELADEKIVPYPGTTAHSGGAAANCPPSHGTACSQVMRLFNYSPTPRVLLELENVCFTVVIGRFCRASVGGSFCWSAEEQFPSPAPLETTDRTRPSSERSPLNSLCIFTGDLELKGLRQRNFAGQKSERHQPWGFTPVICMSISIRSWTFAKCSTTNIEY